MFYSHALCFFISLGSAFQFSKRVCFGELWGSCNSHISDPKERRECLIFGEQNQPPDFPQPSTKNTKNTKKLPSFVLPFLPPSTAQIIFLPSRKLFLRHPFILKTNFHHHSTIIPPHFKLHNWEIVKNAGIRKLGKEEVWEWRGVQEGHVIYTWSHQGAVGHHPSRIS